MPLSPSDRLAASRSRRALLTSALAATGLPVAVPPIRGGGLVVTLDLHALEGGVVDVRGFEAVTLVAWVPGRREALDRAAGVLEALGYGVERRSTGALVFTVPAEVAAEEAEAEEDWTGDCAVEGGLAAVEIWAAAQAVSA